jgi:hypothetical protein
MFAQFVNHPFHLARCRNGRYAAGRSRFAREITIPLVP